MSKKSGDKNKLSAKGGSFIKDFKEFAFKGNILDLAVGVIIGGAFGSIVTSLVNDIFMPVLGLIIGRIDITNLFIALDGASYASLAAAKEAGAPVIAYGSFISGLLNFLLLALCVFLFLKLIVRLKDPRKKKEAPAAPAARLCPYCKQEIHAEATRCPHCCSKLE